MSNFFLHSRGSHHGRSVPKLACFLLDMVFGHNIQKILWRDSSEFCFLLPVYLLNRPSSASLLTVGTSFFLVAEGGVSYSLWHPRSCNFAVTRGQKHHEAIPGGNGEAHAIHPKTDTAERSVIIIKIITKDLQNVCYDTNTPIK